MMGSTVAPEMLLKISVAFVVCLFVLVLATNTWGWADWVKKIFRFPSPNNGEIIEPKSVVTGRNTAEKVSDVFSQMREGIDLKGYKEKCEAVDGILCKVNTCKPSENVILKSFRDKFPDAECCRIDDKYEGCETYEVVVS